jgi:hypothetical protein
LTLRVPLAQATRLDAHDGVARRIERTRRLAEHLESQQRFLERTGVAGDGVQHEVAQQPLVTRRAAERSAADDAREFLLDGVRRDAAGSARPVGRIVGLLVRGHGTRQRYSP